MLYGSILEKVHVFGYNEEGGKDDVLTLAGHRKLWTGDCWSSWKNCLALKTQKTFINQ